MSLLVFFAGMGGGFVASILIDHWKMIAKNSKMVARLRAMGKVGSYDSEGRYYEE